MEQWAEGSVAVCAERSPVHCKELECKPGKVCRERIKDGVSSAICVPGRKGYASILDSIANKTS